MNGNSRSAAGQDALDATPFAPKRCGISASLRSEFGDDNFRLSQVHVGSGYRMQRFLEKAAKREKVTVGLLGGSGGSFVNSASAHRRQSLISRPRYSLTRSWNRPRERQAEQVRRCPARRAVASVRHTIPRASFSLYHLRLSARRQGRNGLDFLRVVLAVLDVSVRSKGILQLTGS